MRWLVSLLLLLALTACGQRAMPAGYAGDDAREFVREHRATLEREIAIGSGPRLRDLAIVADCQDVPELSRMLHRQQANVFGSAGSPAARADDTEVAERVVRLLSKAPELRCLGLELGPRRSFAAGTRHIGPTRNDVVGRGAP
ncbi:MAG: hypothetical protein ABW217_05845 [Polyangiaceae bacterium]